MRRHLAGLAGVFLGLAGSTAIVTALQMNVPQPLLHVIGMDNLSLVSSYVELIVQDGKRRQFGLCTPLGGSFVESFNVQNGTATVLEKGVVRKTTAAPAGTILRILVTDGTVGFLKNGGAIYVGLQPLLEPPRVEVALEDGTTVLGRLTSWSQGALSATALILLQPVPGAAVSGIVSIQAGTVPGTVFPAGVTIIVMSAALTRTVATGLQAPYTTAWDSRLVPNGPYQITATSGLVSSPSVAVTVNN